jgi:hypothetical protein
MKDQIRYLLICTLISGAALRGSENLNAQLPEGYRGVPYKDEVYRGNKMNPYGAQMIPGRVELAFFDLGGEGIAYHDNDPRNEGSLLNGKKGESRPGISEYIAFFRKNEGVDINYTKDNADFGHPNKVDPKVSQLYIGWQEDGEWTNYTVYVNKEGKYIIYTVYSSVENNPAQLWVNNKFSCTLAFPEKTGDLHSWTQSEVGTIIFPKKGLYLLTLKYGRGVNYGYLDFLYNDARQN